MATGWGPTAANAALDTLLAAYTWIKLHIGSPGANGTGNAATETTRKQAAYGAAAVGSATNSGALTWTNVAGAETFTHFSAWSLVAAGTFGFSGTVSASGAVAVADTFTIAIGGLTVTLTLAS